MKKLDEMTDPKSCLSKAADDEPVFVLRAKDKLAPGVVRMWVELARGVHEPEKLEEATRLATLMENWHTNDAQNRLLPSHVLASENLRRSPWCSMFGCAEFEMIAKRITKHLAANGNRWDITIDPRSFATLWELEHAHGEERDHAFVPHYARNGFVTKAFIDQVTRRGDRTQYRDDVMARLILNWPGTGK